MGSFAHLSQVDSHTSREWIAVLTDPRHEYAQRRVESWLVSCLRVMHCRIHKHVSRCCLQGRSSGSGHTLGKRKEHLPPALRAQTDGAGRGPGQRRRIEKPPRNFSGFPYGCETNGIPFWGRCTTHFRTYFSGDGDVHWGTGCLPFFVHDPSWGGLKPNPRIFGVPDLETHPYFPIEGPLKSHGAVAGPGSLLTVPQSEGFRGSMER